MELLSVKAVNAAGSLFRCGVGQTDCGTHTIREVILLAASYNPDKIWQPSWHPHNTDPNEGKARRRA